MLELKRIGDTGLEDEAYLKFINVANRDNDDWVPFDSTESLRTILFSDPAYDSNRHFMIVADKAIVADLLMKIRPSKPSVAEILLSISTEWRGKGLGEELLSVALKRLNQSVDIVRIIVSPGNREILPFAKVHSFKVSKQVDLVHDLDPTELVCIPSGYQIRPTSTNQLGEVTVLRNQIFGAKHRVEELETIIKGRVISINIIVATIRNEVIGYCIAQKDDRTLSEEGSIVEIGVKQEHRRKGIAKAMLLINLEWLKSKGCRRATVNSASNNIPALNLYKETGFRVFRIKEKILEKIVNTLG